MMTGKEKLYFLLNRINDAREIAPSGEPILIDLADDLNNKYTKVELMQLLTKLEKDEKVLEVLRRPTGIDKITLELDPYSDYKDAYYQLKLLPSFDKYFQKIQQEPEYQEFTGTKAIAKAKEPTANSLEARYKTALNDVRKQLKDKPIVIGDAKTTPDSEIIYWITLTPAREILLNDVFLLAKPDFDSENDVVFEYLYKNPNRKISLDELKKKTNRAKIKSLHKIIENLGFRGDIKTLFFVVSKTIIMFRNPITAKELNQLKIKRIKLTLK